MWRRHASTGSSSSRRATVAISAHSRSTSGSPKMLLAQPSVGQAITVQAVAWRETRSRMSSRNRLGSARAALAG